MFTDEDEQREVAGLFNATIHPVEGKNDKATALRETVVRIKQNSICLLYTSSLLAINGL